MLRIRCGYDETAELAKKRGYWSKASRAVQGSQNGSSDYLAFMRKNRLEPSMSRRDNCHDCGCRKLLCDLEEASYSKKDLFNSRRSKDRDIQFY